MNISKWRRLLVAVLAFSVLAPTKLWANSKFLNVQGKLTDSSGNPLTGTNTVTFRLYTSSTAAVGTALWTESLAINFSTGLYNVTLGNVTSLDSVVFNQLYYLGIQVSGDSNELSPRQVLGASAYAQGSLGGFNVGSDLATAGQSIVMGSMTVQGAVLVVGTMTVQANAFSAGGTGIVLSNGKVGIGTSSPQTAIDVNGTAQFGSTAKSTFTSAGALTLASGAALTLSGANGNIISAASVTAGSFFGDGSHLTGAVVGPITSTVSFTATNTSTFTVNAASASFAGPVTFNSGFSFGDASQQTTAAVTVSTYSTGGHSLGTIYHNTTGKPIYVLISASGSGGGTSVVCDAQATPTTVVGNTSFSSAAPDTGTIFFIVLPGFYYKASGGTLSRWTEWN